MYMYYGDRDFRRCLCFSCSARLPCAVGVGSSMLAAVSGILAGCLTCGISCSSAPLMYIILGSISGGTAATGVACCCCACSPRGLCDANSPDSASRSEYYKTFNIQDNHTETTPLSTVVASPYSTNNASTLWSTTSIPTSDGQPQPISINNNP